METSIPCEEIGDFRTVVVIQYVVCCRRTPQLFQKFTTYTDKKENKSFLIYKKIRSGAVAKSYMRKGFLKYEEMRKYFPIYEEAVSHI